MKTLSLFKYTNAQSWAIMAGVLFLAIGMVMPELALAGGIEQIEGKVNEYKTTLYAILGAGATLFILIEVTLLWMNKRQWADIGMDAIKVGLGGAAILLADWAWSLFK